MVPLHIFFVGLFLLSCTGWVVGDEDSIVEDPVGEEEPSLAQQLEECKIKLRQTEQERDILQVKLDSEEKSHKMTKSLLDKIQTKQDNDQATIQVPGIPQDMVHFIVYVLLGMAAVAMVIFLIMVWFKDRQTEKHQDSYGKLALTAIDAVKSTKLASQPPVPTQTPQPVEAICGSEDATAKGDHTQSGGNAQAEEDSLSLDDLSGETELKVPVAESIVRHRFRKSPPDGAACATRNMSIGVIYSQQEEMWVRNVLESVLNRNQSCTVCLCQQEGDDHPSSGCDLDLYIYQHPEDGSHPGAKFFMYDNARQKGVFVKNLLDILDKQSALLGESENSSNL